MVTRASQHDELSGNTARVLENWRNNGFAFTLLRATKSTLRRLRDAYLARTMRAPAFRLGRGPVIDGARFIRIGRDFQAGDFLWIHAVAQFGSKRYAPSITVGAGVSVSNNVHIAAVERVVVGDDTLIGSNVLITDHNHGSYGGTLQSDPKEKPLNRKLHSAPVMIGSNVWLGNGVVVLPGSVIGDGSVIGANSVVRGVVPSRCIAAGSPLRILRRYDGETCSWRKTDHLGELEAVGHVDCEPELEAQRNG